MVSHSTIPSTSRTTTFHRARVDGVSIFYREAGAKDAPAVVLLHGYPSSSRMWDRLIPLLADGFRVIAPDYPGFGLSDAPPARDYSYTFDHLAKTMDDFLDGIGIHRCTIFMQDYGAPVGFRLALARPDRIGALIVQNANAYEEGLGVKWGQGIADYWRDPQSHRDVLDAFMSLDGARQRHIGDSPNVEKYDPSYWEDEYSMLRRAEQLDIQGSLLFDYRNNVASYPKWQAWLREHRPPTLVMWGRFDPSFITPGGLAYRRDVPDAEIHVLDAGHFALDECADEIAGLTRVFLEKHSAVIAQRMP